MIKNVAAQELKIKEVVEPYLVKLKQVIPLTLAHESYLRISLQSLYALGARDGGSEIFNSFISDLEKSGII